MPPGIFVSLPVRPALPFVIDDLNVDTRDCCCTKVGVILPTLPELLCCINWPGEFELFGLVLLVWEDKFPVPVIQKKNA